MIEIDGSHGEGGGQILRTTIGLAAISGNPVTINNIRSGRSKPGLQKQHLCAVRAIGQICGGQLCGDELGSSQLTFHPGFIQAGEYTFEIGTAGSVSLVVQSTLIPLLRADAASTIRIQGGTHNPMAPPVDFLQRVYFPRLVEMGVGVESKVMQYGLYPKGGGEFTFHMEPVSKLNGFNISNRGKLKSSTVWAMVAGLPRHIAERELEVIVRKSKWSRCTTHCIEVENDTGPGNLIMIELEFEHAREIVIEFGKRGVRAEQVAASALRQAKAFIKQDVPVGEHLADQLILPAAIAAKYYGETSRFLTGELSGHTTTHIWLLETLLNLNVTTNVNIEGHHEVVIRA